ncbi:MAG: ArsR family transcriptional regulator [bacterium]
MKKIIKETEKILKVLANRRRLSIISYLKKSRGAKVGDIAGEIKISFKATSKHLGLLFNADVVERDQRNLEMWYKLSPNQNNIARYISNSLE